MKKHFSILFALIIYSLFALASCTSDPHTPCRDILSALTSAEASLPSGKVYDMKAPEGDDEYLSDRVLVTLFGDGEMPSVKEGWLDMALFLSLNEHPCEFAVILCDDPDNASDTARLLLRRLDIIRTAKGSGENTAILDSATVTVIKNYVLLIISSDAQNALKCASRIIKYTGLLRLTA